MKLASVMFCIECEEVFKPDEPLVHDPDNLKGVSGFSCPSCGNTAVVRLSKWVGQSVAQSHAN